MLTFLRAYTNEADDPVIALEEILEQLALGEKERNNTVGILSCHPVFVENGVAAFIAERLPFDVIGCTTLSSSVGEVDYMTLCITALTSDEISFSVARTSPLSVENYREPICEAYRQAVEEREGKPSLIIPFTPLLTTLGNELMMEELDAVSNGVPLFGAGACDNTPGFTKSYTLFNGEISKEFMVMIFFWGDAHPTFYVAHTTRDKIQKHRAIITKSEGCLLMEVNNIPFETYLNSIGLTRTDIIEGLSAAPFFLDYADGTQPVARVILDVTREGHAVFSGAIPENVSLAVGFIDPADIVETTRNSLMNIKQRGVKNGILMFPCVSRSLLMGVNGDAEQRIAKEVLGESIAYMLAYSGGEICPVYDENKHAVNRYHNYTFAACVF